MHVDGDETKTPEGGGGGGGGGGGKKLPLNQNFVTPETEQIPKHRLLGVTVDEQLKWQTHVNNICRTVSTNIYLFSRLSQIVSHKAKFAFSFAHVTHKLCLCFKYIGEKSLSTHEATVAVRARTLSTNAM